MFSCWLDIFQLWNQPAFPLPFLDSSNPFLALLSRDRLYDSNHISSHAKVLRERTEVEVRLLDLLRSHIIDEGVSEGRI